MKKKILILGSTGSIGISTLQVLKKNIKNFDIILLYANNNYKKLISQAKTFKPKNVFIKNKKFYPLVKRALKNYKIRVFSGNKPINKIIKIKVDFTISAIVGFAGLQPTLDSIKVSKNLAIANKESIICGWDLLSALIKKYKTNLIPMDSEHFSIMELTKGVSNDQVEEIIITASGGPFLNLSKNKMRNASPKSAVKHPNWKMGKKISIDSANLMNKVFEIIEACKIFKFSTNKYKIMIHPQSYVHSIIRFKSGLIKMILYNSDMRIPISNILNGKNNRVSNVKNINIATLNKLVFKKVDSKQFPSVNIIKKCLKLGNQAPTIINASNEVLVDLFLDNKIRFLDIVHTINRILRDKNFKKYARKKASSIKDIEKIDNWARLKTASMCVI